MFISLTSAKALVVGDCEVLASYKLYSSLDEEKFICKGKEFGKNTDSIYYSGNDEVVKLNNIDIYYFTSLDKYNITLDITGKNNISLLHLGNANFKVTGNGSLKFKQNSFVKKVDNGEAVYKYQYLDKTIINNEGKIFEGTTLEFEENYDSLKAKNNLPEEFLIDNYTLIQVEDYTKMTSVAVTESWISKHIKTDLTISSEDGFGIIKYEKQTSDVKEENKKLESENVILISDKEVNSDYELNVNNLKEKEVAKKVSKSIDKSLVSLYDVAVYNGDKEVPMKKGKYTLKIKLEDNINEYENYQIIYVDDNGKISEYIDGHIEGEYIVFETSHLSQYGVIATPVLNLEVDSFDHPINNKFNWSSLFKISILASFILLATGFISFIVFKSKLLTKKKKKKRV